jgi:CheY-like chemotaxis protein
MEEAQNMHPDLILLDLSMPVILSGHPKPAICGHLKTGH